MTEPSPPAAPRPVRRLWWIAMWILGVVLWLHVALLREGGILGAPRSDVLRAVWGLDVPVRALPDPPFWTDYIGFPVGVKVLLLPFVSSVVGSPLTAIFGPWAGYDVWILGMLWATGVATAWLAWEWTRSPAAALLAGTWIVAQPMMFVALSDGTAEFVAFWSIPAAMAAWHRGRTDLPWARVGAALTVVVALDSPYHAVFLAPFLPLVAWRLPRRQILEGAAIGAAGGAVLYGLYYGLPVAAVDNSNSNAVFLRIWNQWETGGTVRAWDWTLGAGFIPRVLLAGALLLAALRPLRALPWVAIGLLMLVWSLGRVPENNVLLTQWFGVSGTSLGNLVDFVNTSLVPPVVRFPRRWLVPVAFALGMGAAVGLTRLPREWMRFVVAVPASVFALVWVTRLTGYREGLPHFPPPPAAFVDFVRDHDQDGAILVLPRMRAAKTSHMRDDLPVFASLSPDLASADQTYIQIATGRPSAYAPQGMRTVTPRYGYGQDLNRLLHDLDDLANPGMVDAPIPPSALQEPARRAVAAGRLVDAGLGFVIVDEALYGTEGVEHVAAPFADTLIERRHFDDGTGVTVLVVGRKP